MIVVGTFISLKLFLSFVLIKKKIESLFHRHLKLHASSIVLKYFFIIKNDSYYDVSRIFKLTGFIRIYLF